MLKKLIFTFVIVSQTLIAEQLVHVRIQNRLDAEKRLHDYSCPIFYEDRFILTLESNLWKSSNSNQTAIADWDKSLYYYVLYSIRPLAGDRISTYGTVLFADQFYLIFESKYEVLNDFEAFHQFEIVRLTDKSIPDVKPLKYNSSMQFDFNSVIQQMVDSVKIDSVWNFISTLQSMERYTTNPNALGSSNYLKDYYIALGFDSVYFHYWHTGYIPNVIAVKYGKELPDDIYILGGHYDVYTNGAPGADDDGSGTASIMEAARVLSASSYKRTIKLINFSGEEMGLLGSQAYASQASQNGHNILGMVNMDMIAYVASGDPIDVDLIKNTASTDLANAYVDISQMYVPSLSIVNGYLVGGTSDHASFWNNGYPAIFPFEDSDHYSPYIHSSNDVLGVSANSQTLAELGTKSAVATIAALAEIAETRITGHVYSSETLSPIQEATVFFNGDSVQTNGQGYYITPPLTAGMYSIVFTASGFEADTVIHSVQPYEIFDADGYLIPEGSTRPYVHLKSIAIDDDSTGASLGNGDGVVDAGETIEIFGSFMNIGNLNAYDISAKAQAISPWITILQDSIEIDSVQVGSTSLSNNAFVVTIDPETPKNSEIEFSLIIYYQGYITNSGFEISVSNRGDVLIVEDDNGENGLDAYETALDSLKISYDVGNASTALDIMQQYNYVIWFCGDDYSTTLTSSDQQKLASYLDDGGKLFINGNDIGFDIHNDPFYSNYLKATYLDDGSYSTTAFGISGDPISGDFTSGVQINTNYVDRISPTGGASQVFYYNSSYGCGIKYEGDYQLVYLTFIYETMPNPEDRELLLSNVFKWFGAVTDLAPTPGQKTGFFSLSQNYPNPFNPVTQIRFGLPKSTDVRIEIFNILGQRVSVLIDGKRMAGQHKVEFDGRRFASGIYFYRLKAGDFIDVKKMVLIR